MQKNIVLKLGVVALCAIALGSYIIWDKQHAPLATAPTVHLEQYSSEDGVSFMYPDSYKLSSASHTVDGYTWDSLELIDKNYTPPVNGEGPQSISMSVFTETRDLTLEQWIKNEPHSNYLLSKDRTLTRGTIGGKESLAYQFSGLYENDAVVVRNGNKYFLFSDSWAQTVDPIRHDFNTVLSSVQFH